MLFNTLFGIYCFECKKYIDPYQVLLDVLYKGSITCEHDHLIGNDSDPQWIEFFKQEIEE